MQNLLHVAEGEPSASLSTPIQGPEGRKFVRYQITLLCHFSSDHSSGKGRVVDVSTGGCKVESSSHASPGEYLCLSLQGVVPNQPISVDLAMVRWSHGRAFGLEFIRMEPAQQERLRLLVQGIEMDVALHTPPHGNPP